MTRKKTITNGSILVVSAILVNIFNFLFNAYMGRALSFEDLSVIALFNSFSYLVTVFFTALYATVTNRSSHLRGKYGDRAGYDFLKSISRRAVQTGIVAAAAWVLLTPLVSQFFHTSPVISLLFAPIILIGFITYANEGYLQGSFKFAALAVVLVSEVVTKLVFGWGIVTTGYHTLAVAAIPASAIIAYALSIVMINREVQGEDHHKSYAFPTRFFMAAVVSGLASMAYLTFDVLLAKHFMSATMAGQYSLLALIGKMIFFFGVLPNMFLLTLVSRDVGAGRNPSRVFYTLLAATSFLIGSAYVVVVLWGAQLLPILFGSKVLTIVPYLNTYVGAIALFAVSGAINSYHLARQQYMFSYISIVMAAIMCVVLMMYHADISAFANTLCVTAGISVLVMGTLHILEAHHIIRLKEGIS